MAHDVFISYSSRDKPIADGICANLEAAGVRCWIAPRDIAPGEDWPTAISLAISQSRSMVLVFSANSNNSAEVSRELILAANNKLIIIPFKIEDVAPVPGMQYYLARTHWLDAMNPPTSEQIHTLIETVKKLLPPETLTPTPLPPESPPVSPKPQTAKAFKPWMLWLALSLVVIAAIWVGGTLLTRNFNSANTNSLTPTQTESVSAQMPVQGVTASAPVSSSSATSTSTLASPPTATPIPASSASGPRPTALPRSAQALSVENAVQVKNLKKLDATGSYVAWSADGKWLVIGERQIHFYDPSSMKEMHSFQADRWVNGLAISPDSKVLAAIDESRGVMLFDMSTGSQLRTLPDTTISTSAASSSFLAFSPDSSTLAVVLGNTVKLFNLASGQETSTIVAKDTESIVFSADGQSLYAGGGGGLTVLNVASGAQTGALGSYTAGGATRLALSPDGSLLASGGMFDDPLVLYDTASGQQLRSFSGHKGGINSLSFSPDGKLLASSAGDVTIKLWDAASGNLLQTLVGPSEPTISLAISPDGATIASSGESQPVMLWGLPGK